MVEIRASDWDRSVRWYSEVLGLPVVLRDEPRSFALVGEGGSRIALKAGGRVDEDRTSFRLTFRVGDADAERARLLGLGEVVGEVREDREEGYREVRLGDPDGTPISLFSFGSRP
jgi:catechol 2,3-dioxygenase-like lactoylglutathione lyase family enzyme